MMFERDTILNDLRKYACEVYFTKLNGDKRRLRCSLRPDLLPEQYSKETISEEKDYHQKNPEVIVTWDLETGGWRSFRIDSIEYIQVLDTYQ